MRWLDSVKKVTAYLASGWFNDAEEKSRQDIIKALEDNSISYFSPKDEVEVKLDATSEERKAAFKADTESIKNCDFVLASTTGKDMGTLMEMGMAYAWGVPCIVYFPAPKGTPCNLMIAESAYAVAQSPEELDEVLKRIKKEQFIFSNNNEWKGTIE